MLLPTKMPKTPPTTANLKKVLSGMRLEPCRALALSMPIRTNPMKPEKTSQLIISVQIGLNLNGSNRW